MKTNSETLLFNNIRFMDAACYGNEILFFDSITRAFFQLNMKNDVMCFIPTINANAETPDVVRNIIPVAEDLFCVQNDPCKVFRYRRSMDGVEFIGCDDVNGFNGRAKVAYKYNKKIWIFPINGRKKIAIYDIDRHDVQNFTCKVDEISMNETSWELTESNSHVYILCDGVKKIFDLDLRDGEIKSYTIPIKEKIKGIATRKGKLLLRTINGEMLYEYNMETQDAVAIAFSKSRHEEGERIIVKNDGTIFLGPAFSNKFYFVDEKNKMICPIEDFGLIAHVVNGTYTVGYIDDGNDLCIYPWAGSGMTRIGNKDGTITIRKQDFVISKSDYKEYLAQKMKRIKKEEIDLGLRELIHLL